MQNTIKARLIIPLITAFIITGHLMSCASADTKDNIVNAGESSPLLSGTRWEYSEDDSSSSVYYVEFNGDGNAIWYDNGNKVVPHLTTESIWYRQGNTITIINNAGYRYMEGQLLSDNNPKKITGAGENRLRKEWKFTMIEN